MKEKKGIIFDMDGTVWDSSENVAAARPRMSVGATPCGIAS